MTDLSVEQIIYNKDIFPTIVNPKSSFVIVTYWWGRGRLNKNTSRPCLDFYEKLLMRPFIMLASYADNLNGIPDTYDLLNFLQKTKAFRKFYAIQAAKYTRESGLRSVEENERIIIDIVSTAFRANRALALQLQNLTYQRIQFGKEFKKKTKKKESLLANNSLKDSIFKKQIENLSVLRDKIKDHIKSALRHRTDPALNFVDQLEEALMYKPPLSYEQMIERWENDCVKASCNHMAVEYPEFALPGGYQKAINAKPLFIQKALQSCGGLAVLYIDGDMKITQYPYIFDMPDIDFMARGWNIDPRSSYKYRPPDIDEGEDWNPSISMDPYVFETSGGIMYFSDSQEAHGLLNLWVTETAKPVNQGKADDRIISLIFNTKHLLAPMKIFQLPIEYLWLTMDYEYSVAPDDWNPAKVYVTHPECLTSEDTAGAQGASSSRQPKYYEAVEGTITDRSEILYESVMFTSPRMVEQCLPWLNYIGNATYYSGDLEGESPFYVVPWGRYGRKEATLKANQTALMNAANISTSENKNIGYIIMNEDNFSIINILSQLKLGNDILYLPSTATAGYVTAARNTLDVDHNERIELMFADTHGKVKSEDFFMFTIDLAQPIYLRHGNFLLYIMIALCANLEEFSTTLHANYQFLSRIRIHVLKSVKKPFYGGGNNNNNNNNNDTEAHDTTDAYTALYKTPIPRVKRIEKLGNALALLATDAKEEIRRKETMSLNIVGVSAPKSSELHVPSPMASLAPPVRSRDSLGSALTFSRIHRMTPSVSFPLPSRRPPTPTLLLPGTSNMLNNVNKSRKSHRKRTQRRKTRKN